MRLTCGDVGLHLCVRICAHVFAQVGIFPGSFVGKFVAAQGEDEEWEEPLYMDVFPPE